MRHFCPNAVCCILSSLDARIRSNSVATPTSYPAPVGLLHRSRRLKTVVGNRNGGLCTDVSQRETCEPNAEQGKPAGCAQRDTILIRKIHHHLNEWRSIRADSKGLGCILLLENSAQINRYRIHARMQPKLKGLTSRPLSRVPSPFYWQREL